MSLHVHDLRVYYQTLHGEVRAVDGVSFGIADGAIMGLAGGSGCGKTTLGYSLVRLTPPRRLVAGRAVLDGLDHRSGQRRSSGVAVRCGRSAS